jgi:protein-S-isoprenylcysteine O-methyltransferase Ste14
MRIQWQRLWFVLAGVTLMGGWGFYFLTGFATPYMAAEVIGWVLLAAGYFFIFFAIFTLRRRGGASKGRDFAHTTRVITNGVYGLIRHPLYFGWLVMYLSLICFSQHWAAFLSGGVGVVSMVMIARQEDQALIEKFGEPYREYQADVPGLNLLVGVYRKIFRR